jgi:hypothetical protein
VQECPKRSWTPAQSGDLAAAKAAQSWIHATLCIRGARWGGGLAPCLQSDFDQAAAHHFGPGWRPGGNFQRGFE